MASFQMTSQCATLNIRSHKKKTPLVLTKLKQRQNMFMFEVSANLRFAQETRASCNIMHKIRTNNFDCYIAAKSASLVCEIDLSHTTHIYAAYKVIITKTR